MSNVCGFTVTNKPPRVTVDWDASDVPGTVDSVARVLERIDCGLYWRGGRIVSVGWQTMPTWDGGTVDVQLILERDEHGLMDDIERDIRFAFPGKKARSTRRRRVRCLGD
jgi:hypothetical protein